jgi:uronate dehydrogenase
MKYVLITGAVGLIGTGLRENFKGRYRLRLSDIRTPDNLREDEEFVEADIRDFDAVQGIVEGVDAVVHMGGVASEGTWEDILSANIVGTYHVMEAARQTGAKRVIYASSVHAIGFYPRSQRIGVDVTVRPDSRYGVSKAFGESIGALYADKYGLEVMAVRIGNAFPEPIDERRLSIWTSHADLAQLVGIGLDHPDLHYEIVYGVSGNTRSWWDNSNAERLGYRPKDNAEDWADEVMAKAPQDPSSAGAHVQGGDFAFLESGGGSPPSDDD